MRVSHGRPNQVCPLGLIELNGAVLVVPLSGNHDGELGGESMIAETRQRGYSCELGKAIDEPSDALLQRGWRQTGQGRGRG